MVGRRTAAITLFSDRHLGGGALLLSVALISWPLLARSDVACCELCPWQRPYQDRQRVLQLRGLLIAQTMAEFGETSEDLNEVALFKNSILHISLPLVDQKEPEKELNSHYLKEESL